MGETANADAFVEVSGILKAHAVNLIKIANDLRLMNFLGEIHLPQLQAGSSIMPGKVNPVVAEAAIQTGMKVIANDASSLMPHPAAPCRSMNFCRCWRTLFWNRWIC